MLRLSRQTGLTPATIEVDGPLDVVAAYDLRRMFAEVIREGESHIVLDLSRVSWVDDAGIQGLSWCSLHAIDSERLLTWSGCSQPLLSALRRSRSPQG